jgi:hypothetical protein
MPPGCRTQTNGLKTPSLVTWHSSSFIETGLEGALLLVVQGHPLLRSDRIVRVRINQGYQAAMTVVHHDDVRAGPEVGAPDIRRQAPALGPVVANIGIFLSVMRLSTFLHKAGKAQGMIAREIDGELL